MRRVLVLETNEIPLDLLEWYAARAPRSAIAEILSTAAVGQSRNTDELGVKGLYPSQTWATMGTGAPFETHGIYWYGDPKPANLPFYWQAAAQERSVGVFGVLHTSLAEGQRPPSNYSFFVPDAFSESAATSPKNLEALQTFNLSMTEENARAVASVAPVKRYLGGAAGAVAAGVRPPTLAKLAQLAGGVAARQIPKERMRTGQFLLLADPFLRLVRKTDPDLAVMFTNHVAAAMHRYWYASFPDDWEEELFDDEWVASFENEIPTALAALDDVVGEALEFCRATDRTLLMLSSMGQRGGAPLNQSGDAVLVVKDHQIFLERLGVTPGFELRKSMVPHMCAAFDSPEQAKSEADGLRAAVEGALTIDVSGEVMTVSYHLPLVGAGNTEIAGQRYSYQELGVEELAVEEHRCGVHDPLGAVIIANSPSASIGGQIVDAREVAPALPEALGVEPLSHHEAPSFKF